MKRFFFLFLLLILPLMAEAQFGNRYFWCDTLNATTTARDCTWTDVWEVATIYGDADMLLRIGAPDVGNWTSRRWVSIEEGLALTIGPSPNLKKITWKTASGTGVLYVVGYKESAQTYSSIWREDREKAIYSRNLVPVTFPATDQ